MKKVFQGLAIFLVLLGLFQSLTFIGGTVQCVLADGFAAVVFAILSGKSER